MGTRVNQHAGHVNLPMATDPYFRPPTDWGRVVREGSAFQRGDKRSTNSWDGDDIRAGGQGRKFEDGVETGI
jgi:hypothetical protein